MSVSLPFHTWRTSTALLLPSTRFQACIRCCRTQLGFIVMHSCRGGWTAATARRSADHQRRNLDLRHQCRKRSGRALDREHRLEAVGARGDGRGEGERAGVPAEAADRRVVAAVGPVEQLLVGDDRDAARLRGGDDRLGAGCGAGLSVCMFDAEGAVVALRAERVVEQRVDRGRVCLARLRRSCSCSAGRRRSSVPSVSAKRIGKPPPFMKPGFAPIQLPG